jgi:HK97 family phage major capsid protein
MDIAERLLNRIETYQARVDDTASEFRRRLAALEAPENREVAINLGARAKLSPKARDSLRDYVRKAGNQEHLHLFLNPKAASMTIGSDPDGGYTVLPEIDTAIRLLTREVSPMRSVATVRTISGDELRLVVETGALPPAAWVGEQESRPTTAGSQFGQVSIPAMECYTSPTLSNLLADDNSFDVVDFLLGRIAISLAILEGTAFIAGDGNKKPKGLTTYPVSSADDNSRAAGTFQYIPTGASGTPTNAQLAAALVSASESLRPEFTARAVWLMTRATRAVIRTLTYSGSDSRLLWTPNGGASTGYTDKRPDELLGYPIVTMPDMPSLSTANALPIAFGDIAAGYTIVDKKGVQILKDIYTQKGFTTYYSTLRCGGGASGGNGFNAVKLVKNSIS